MKLEIKKIRVLIAVLKDGSFHRVLVMLIMFFTGF